jgi:periplasmic copper chaperone A
VSRATVTTERSRARRASRTVRLLAVGGVAVAGLALAGCGAGQIAQTSQQVAAVGGANAGAGYVAVRNAEIAYPAGMAPSAAAHRAGGTAEVEMTIVNTGNTADRLLSASSAAGSGVTLTGEQNLAPQLALVAGDQSSANLPGTKKLTVEITGLREDILSGRTYPLTLTFANAGNVVLDLPVALPTAPRQDQAPEKAEGGGH